MAAFLAVALAFLAKLAPYKGVVALAAVVVVLLVLSILAIHLPSATQRAHFAVALGLVSFFAGFLLPRAQLPSL